MAVARLQKLLMAVARLWKASDGRRGSGERDERAKVLENSREESQILRDGLQVPLWASISKIIEGQGGNRWPSRAEGGFQWPSRGCRRLLMAVTKLQRLLMAIARL